RSGASPSGRPSTTCRSLASASPSERAEMRPGRVSVATVRRVLGRVAETVATVLVVSAASFALLGLTKGDAATAVVEARGDPVTAEAVAAERARLGLDLPAIPRYVHTVGQAVHGDFGTSVRTGFPVAQEVAQRLVP